MNQKCIEHIILYSLVLVGTLVVGVLVVSMFYPRGLTISVVVLHFLQAVIVLMAIYASLQTTFKSVSAAIA